jgi:membrane-bound serine protease (ClpP class)
MKSYKIITFILVLLTLFNLQSVAFAKNELVYTIHVNGVIDNGLYNFVKRGIREAEENHAKALIFEINTPGGEIKAASNISNAILNTDIPTIAYVNNEALSAGVIVAISCQTIAVSPTAAIGAAETRPKEEKYISAWAAQLRSVAEKTGRNKELVAAMADEDIVIEGLKEKGKILSLTSNEALEWGIADEIVENIDELLKSQNLSDASVRVHKPNSAEKFAQFITNPFISPIILTIGIVGVVTEILTPGFGLPGLLGILAFTFFFGGNILAGITSYWVILLFVLGIILLTVEIFIPGFGVFGIFGIILTFTSIIIAFPSIEQALISIIFAILASGITIFLLFKYLIKTTALDRLILNFKQEKSEGYSASKEDFLTLLDQEGVAITPLRPAGTGEFKNGRFDVVSEGEYISAGSKIKVIKVEGNKIVVKTKKGE